jgi:cytochrome P450
MASEGIVADCCSLLIGADVTTPHPPDFGMAEFIDTGVLQDGPAHPEAAADAALNEPPRRASPVNHFPRYATRDVEIRSTGPFRPRVYAGGRLPPLKGSP